LRALIIGFGSIGKRHARNLRALMPDAQIRVVRASSATDPVLAELRGERAGSLAEGLRWRPDLAVVASPSALHLEALVPLLEAGVPCYLEKPIVASRDQLDALEAILARLARVPPVQVGCNLRFLPSLRRLREIMRRGELGHPARASLEVGQWLPDWRAGQDYRVTYSASRAAGGGVVLDLIHEIDMARWLLGELECVGSAVGRLSGLEIDTEDTAAGVFVGAPPGGAIVTVAMDYVARTRVRRYSVIGTRASAVWDLAMPLLSVANASGTRELTRAATDFDLGPTYVEAMREFLTAVKSGTTPTVTLEDGLATMRLALDMRDEARAAGRP
jgi:predicted dehydrogenase